MDMNYLVQRFGLQDKKCLITGGTKGIGKAIVEEFCKLGAQVFTCARSEDDVKAVLAGWQARGLSVQGCAADVSTVEGRQELVAQVTAAFGGELHVLVNNVGTNIRKPGTVAYSDQDFTLLMEANLGSAFALCRLCYPLLCAAHDAVVLFDSSVAGGPTAMRSGALYAMSKAGMNQLAKNLACEWAKDGIRVNSVAPWYTATELAQQVLKDDKYKAEVLSRTPMGRVGEPQDVAGLMAFLSSPAAAYITGQTIAVDGGYSIMGFY